MLSMQVSFLLFLGVFATSLSFKINTNITDGFTNDSKFDTAPFVKIGNGLYYIESNLKTSWFEANERCHKHDAELVTFETMEEWVLINKYLLDNVIEGIYWTSGNDLAKEGRHVWLANGEDVGSWLWTRDQPDNVLDNEHCHELGFRRTENDRRALNDAHCADNVLYICEKRQLKTFSMVIY
ncbi:C-type lectin 37Da-like [Drosophila albomicans]|uniref:C-type lectin 37Da-like n=1 Tax=Drosophila albomicans TaxID=7291 RepID=A0A6P8W7G9_DROAB|nr:C-type lectin 37Da-like [Drosophila albomicans]